ncbi:hypothetical protein [Methylobacterium aquaticum]|jgi:hypothetical protein|uniref:hypothetical protein n=1 Tax=Methylobacterium aquaticum TaxID=270351 RepID=UPI0007C635D7|nr:hypothetical protein [Methylobacterium aquaticum]
MGLSDPDPSHPAGPYSSERLFEWAIAVMMVMIAVTLAMPGDTLERTALRPIAALGATEENMATFYAVVGIARGFALYMNGHINNGRVFPSGAYIRAWCALFSAVVWGQLTLALFMDAFHANSPSLNIPVFGTLTMFELLSCYIARRDAVRRKDTLEGQIEDLKASAAASGLVLTPKPRAHRGEATDA